MAKKNPPIPFEAALAELESVWSDNSKEVDLHWKIPYSNLNVVSLWCGAARTP